jgi:hypothetical protein
VGKKSKESKEHVNWGKFLKQGDINCSEEEIWRKYANKRVN